MNSNHVKIEGVPTKQRSASAAQARPLRLFAAILLILPSVAAAESTDTGSLTLSGDIAARAGVNFLETSADGNYLYALVRELNGSPTPDSLLVYSRDPATGVLNEIQALEHVDGVVDGIDGIWIIEFAPGEEHAYMTDRNQDGIALYDRDISSGLLTYTTSFVDGVDGVQGLRKPGYSVISPDGLHLYVNADDENGIEGISVFARDVSDGSLSFVEMLTDGTSNVSGLFDPGFMVLSPDGLHLYVTNASFSKGQGPNGTVVVFARDTTTGQLTFVESIEETGKTVWGDISADGTYLYVAEIGSPSPEDGAIVVFQRDELTGRLTRIQIVPTPQILFSLCRLSPDRANFYLTGIDFFSVYAVDDVTGLLELVQIDDDAHYAAIAIPPDGAHVYMSTNELPDFIFDTIGTYNRLLARDKLNGAGFYEEGWRLELSIAGSVDLAKSIQWRKDGINLTDDARVSGSTTRDLVIDPLELSDTGLYSVLYDNGAKSATAMGPAAITVFAPDSLPISKVAVLIALVAVGMAGVFRRLRSVN